MSKKKSLLQLVKAANKKQRAKTIRVPLNEDTEVEFRINPIPPDKLIEFSHSVQEGKDKEPPFAIATKLVRVLMPQCLADPETGELVFVGEEGEAAFREVLQYAPAVMVLARAGTEILNQLGAGLASKNSRSRMSVIPQKKRR